MTAALSDPQLINIDSSVEAFAEIAGRYCAWAEGPAGEGHDDMIAARRILAELHLAVLDLTDICPGTETADKVTADDWRAVYVRFESLPVQGRWDVFNPLKLDEPVFNTLSDDLADIYRDLKEGLVLFDQGKVVEAIWEWRMNFDIHWGRHLTSAQRAIYEYFFRFDPDDATD